MSSDLKPIHPEVMYAERSSTTEPEKVSLDTKVKEFLADHISFPFLIILYQTERHLLHH
jgi:hypothetical protein